MIEPLPHSVDVTLPLDVENVIAGVAPDRRTPQMWA